MSVEVQDDAEIPIDTARLRARLQAGLDRAGHPDAELSVLLIGDERMAELNRTYRNISTTTDVLSFPQGTPADQPFASILGDIVISVPTAQLQAEERAISLDEEMEFLAFHGLAHLFGHDHETEGWETWERALEAITPHD